jgi:DNA-binding LytR/AlgR family response regulator
MKIVINEGYENEEPEIIINCMKADESILRICAGLQIYNKRLTGERDGETFLLNASEVLYIDTVERKTFLYTEGGVFETSLKLYELEERLSSEEFIRATKSSILNFSKVTSIRTDFGGRLNCTMENGEVVIVSRQYAVKIKQKLGLIKENSK